jgi:hypothetical protein
LLASLCALGLAAGCAAGPAPLRAPKRAAVAPGELRVELVFGAGSDLDLYVTDPMQETVYYANTPSRGSAGRLEADLRCDAVATPRVETIVFESAPAGRYRVGVDRARTCDAGSSAAEPFLVAVEFAGERREVRGEILGGRFEPSVLEIDVPARHP